MKCYISPQNLKKQTKILTKNWHRPLKSMSSRKILVSLYGYKDPHDYTKYTSQTDGSCQVISKEYLLQNLEYFIHRLADVGDISPHRSLEVLSLLWPGYIHKKGFHPYYCSISFHGILQDFLITKGDTPLPYGFNGTLAVKDAIESLGIPHTEVSAIIVNDIYVDFTYILQPDDKIKVYPHYYTGDIAQSFSPVPDKPLFVLDVHLGVLAKYLRMAGIDTVYKPTDLGDELLAKISEQENRLLLTRDIGLLKRGNVTYGYWVRNTDPQQQFKEIVERYSLAQHFNSFTRCTECNGTFSPIDRKEVRKRPEIALGVLEEHSSFQQCSSCEKIYWRGSHFDRMNEFLSQFQK